VYVVPDTNVAIEVAGPNLHSTVPATGLDDTAKVTVSLPATVDVVGAKLVIVGQLPTSVR
jgi:hypothetical protein